MTVGHEKQQETEGATQLEDVAASYSSMQRQLKHAVHAVGPLLEPLRLEQEAESQLLTACHHHCVIFATDLRVYFDTCSA